ncbi:hypothetical protein Q9R08_00715 [Microbacterium sp. QXD-8]|jgi:hypothetical protein|uniref:CopG family transcriptional regulator n=1 Tax=Microbacterium psychrotolerans TaxID=3068321 RepID=A0ABU0YW06_9MICO|nr:hypothetical protein [Microbacterium sp. QXD-8]MDQ7876487.1 hypothetical protein [Microbacterium sp. QXD-8]
MEDPRAHIPDDLTGSVDDRQRQLELHAAESLSAEWLRRQLDNALIAWSAAATEVDISREAHTDY